MTGQFWMCLSAKGTSESSQDPAACATIQKIHGTFVMFHVRYFLCEFVFGTQGSRAMGVFGQGLPCRLDVGI